MELGLDINKLDLMTQDMYKRCQVRQGEISLNNTRQSLEVKYKAIERFLKMHSTLKRGSISSVFYNELNSKLVEFKRLYEDFNENLMIFIVGNGNVGKSTLLNSLVGQEVAATNFLPNTWKIDVYSPLVQKGKTLVRYNNGKSITLSQQETNELITKEESKTAMSKKKYNDAKKERIKAHMLIEEKEEIKKELSRRLLYHSPIAEVHWSVEMNWILNKSLLVDTPGLNQSLCGPIQIGSMKDYYHKADGVIWLLDANTISAQNTKKIYEDLQSSLLNVGGIRENVIGVINRIDLVQRNGGAEATKKILKEAEGILGDNFSTLIPLSSKQAFEGIKNKDQKLIEHSGITKLQKSLQEIFINNALDVKGRGKSQGCKRLVLEVDNLLNEFGQTINEFQNEYEEMKKELEVSVEKLKVLMTEEIKDYIKNYLNQVDFRIRDNINFLAMGEGKEFIIKNMYQFDEFKSDLKLFSNQLQKEINMQSTVWIKKYRVCEYKYLVKEPGCEDKELIPTIEFEFSELNLISGFNPVIENGLFSIISNGIGKFMFNLKRGKIIYSINQIISEICVDIQKMRIEELNNSIELCKKKSLDILEKSYEEILFKQEEGVELIINLEALGSKINEKIPQVTLVEILL